MKSKLIVVLLTVLVLLVGCNTQETQTAINVRVVADDRGRDYQYFEPITVEQFLDEAEIEVGTLDRMSPQPWTQIYDGITITIVRVTEDGECQEVEIPYRQERRQAEGIADDEERVVQAGQNGLEEICYRLTFEDGELQSRAEISRTITIEPQNEIIYIAPTTELEPVSITGTLAYINNKNAWMMRGNSINKRPLTVTGDLDRQVFSLSADGRQLLIARTNDDEEPFGNQLWLIPDITVDEPALVPLIPQDVLYAAWMPEESNVISYSTAEPRDSQPGWSAANDFWRMRINPQTGEHISFTEILDRSTGGGPYGWWGMQYKWSPDGNYLAWIRADSVGLVNLESGELVDPPLLEYDFLNPLQDWSWRTTVSWSMDNSLIIATVHGPPYGNEPAETSTVFDIAVAAVDGSFSATIIEKTGIWAAPAYSPQVYNADDPFPIGYLAYLQAREWDESINGEYDLVIADRDGSNARVIFPPPGQPGIGGQFGELAWSPDGQQLGFIYLRNLWIVNVETGIAYQLTQDGGASKPVWAS
jgi:resuscitation-promoting factor RpfB